MDVNWDNNTSWFLVIHSFIHPFIQLEELQSSKPGMLKRYHLLIEDISKRVPLLSKVYKGKGLDLGAEPPCTKFRWVPLTRLSWIEVHSLYNLTSMCLQVLYACCVNWLFSVLVICRTISFSDCLPVWCCATNPTISLRVARVRGAGTYHASHLIFLSHHASCQEKE